MVTRRATSRACVASPAPSAAPTSDCAAMATASRARALKNQSCSAIWCAPTDADPEAGRDRGRRQEAGLERGTADEQVTAETSCRPITAGTRPQRARLAHQRDQERPPETVCATTLATAEPVRPQPSRIDQHRAEDRREHVGAEHEEQRAPGVLHAAHPAVAGRREQQAGGAERGDPQPAGRRVGGGRVAGQGSRERSGQDLGRAEPAVRRRPSASQDAWTPSATAPARSPAPNRRAARPVVPYAISVPSQAAADMTVPLTATAASGTPAEVADDGGVDQHVERLGGQHHERRQGQRGDPPRRGRGRGGSSRSQSEAATAGQAGSWTHDARPAVRSATRVVTYTRPDEPY